MEIAIFALCALLIYIIVVCVLVHQNNRFLRHADKRLDKANEMVLTLAHSADELSKSISELKDMMVHLESVYTTRNDMLVKNRDEYREAYQKLLHKYEQLEEKTIHNYDDFSREIFNTIKEMARKPTITNNPK